MQNLKPGARVLVTRLNSSKIIGLGTYLGMSRMVTSGGKAVQRVLLDKIGVEITAGQGQWNEAPRNSPEAPPFKATLARGLGTFSVQTGTVLTQSKHWLSPGYEIEARKTLTLMLRGFDVVVVEFIYDDQTLYVLATEMSLPLYNEARAAA